MVCEGDSASSGPSNGSLDAPMAAGFGSGQAILMQDPSVGGDGANPRVISPSVCGRAKHRRADNSGPSGVRGSGFDRTKVLLHSRPCGPMTSIHGQILRDQAAHLSFTCSKVVKDDIKVRGSIDPTHPEA